MKATVHGENSDRSVPAGRAPVTRALKNDYRLTFRSSQTLFSLQNVYPGLWNKTPVRRYLRVLWVFHAKDGH